MSSPEEVVPAAAAAETAEGVPSSQEQQVGADQEQTPEEARGALPFPGPAPLDEDELSGPAYYLYRCLMFFAYWFAANRFEYLETDRMSRRDLDAYMHSLGLRGKSARMSPQESLRREQEARERARSPSGQGAETSQSTSQDAAEAQQNSNAQDDLEALPMPRNKSCCFGFIKWVEHEAEDLGRVEVTGQDIVDRIERTQFRAWFVILQVLIVFLTWFVWVIIKQEGSFELSTFNPMMLRAGFDDFFGGGHSDGPTDLRVAGPNCEDYRYQVYRWLSYQWTHVSAVQVVVNCFLLVIFGVPLNGLFGFWRTLALHNIGVLSGALCYFWWDAHNPAVGTSGGIYAFVGVHVADYFLNFKSKKFKKTIPIFIIVLVLIDVLSYFLAVQPEYTSGGPYLGGFIAGKVIGGLVYGKTRFVRVFAGVVGLAFLAFSVVWMSTQFAPRNIAEAIQGEPGWCWLRQFWDHTINEESWLCVRCGSSDCMNTWSQQQNLLHVRSWAECTDENLYYADPER